MSPGQACDLSEGGIDTLRVERASAGKEGIFVGTGGFGQRRQNELDAEAAEAGLGHGEDTLHRKVLDGSRGALGYTAEDAEDAEGQSRVLTGFLLRASGKKTVPISCE